MKALVTGSSGFVGRHLFAKLMLRGYSIVCCDFDAPCGPLRKNLATDWHGPFDVIVHLAANIVNVDARMKAGISAYADIALDLAFCKWVEQHPPTKALVLMSSCAVDFPDDPYCIVKRNLEAFAKTLHKKGVPVIVLRPFSGYGEDQSEEYPFRAILERALRKEDPLTVWGGNQVRDWVHVDDLTDGILYAIEHVEPSALPIEIGTGKGCSLHYLARAIAESVGYEPTVKSLHDKPASSSRRVAGERDWEDGPEYISEMLQRWGWKPKITLAQGIARAVAARHAQMGALASTL